MKVYADFNEEGRIRGFYDDFAYPPVMQTVSIKPDPYEDQPEDEWPTEQRFVSRNADIPAGVVEITNQQRFDIVGRPQSYRYDRTTNTISRVTAEVKVYPPASTSLSDWRTGLDLWMRNDGNGERKSRLTDVAAAVKRVLDSGAPIGKVAQQQLEYSNTVELRRLLTIREVFGFSEDDCRESMWRAGQVAALDYRGVWPLPDGEQPGVMPS